MKTVNLYSELQKITEDPDPQEVLLLKESQQILDSNSAEELEVLRILGIDKNLIASETIHKIEESAEKFEDVYEHNAIQTLAINYHLRFLPASFYVGNIDPVLPRKILNFCKNHEIEFNKKEDRFYILAPVSSFKLKEKPLDPIMFYKINDQKYAFIWNWGNDLNKSRYYWSMLNRTSWTLFFSWWVGVFGCTFLIVGLFDHLNSLQDKFIGSIIFGFAIAIVVGMACDGFAASSASSNWNSEF